MKLCPICEQVMMRHNDGAMRGWFCWECDNFVEDEDDTGEDE